MKAVFTFLLIASVQLINAQDNVYYRIYLKDKGNHEGYRAEDLLSERALIRREKAGVPAPDYRDYPVYKPYLNEISDLGFILHSTSKWMNTALFRARTTADPSMLSSLPFISEVKAVKTAGSKARSRNKLDFKMVQQYYPYDRPITMLNGMSLHNNGYTGYNILIAVLDGGFLNADTIESLENLRSRNGIKATHDFVSRSGNVYRYSTHGTAVMSILAGDIPGYLKGTAPDADYILLVTENVSSEFPYEEDLWAAGAEYADSAGADIISSSLGYYIFDDPSLDYKHSDLDGNTAFITKVADIAASKGILVVNSAGNERDNTWQKIIFPSDGDSVLSAGAVDEDKVITYFSSAGPSADRRIKPDNAALGEMITVQTSRGYVSMSAGTSFSCPVLSGMAACLMQAVPQALNTDIIDAFHKAGDRYASPDSLYGYGIPDMTKALAVIQDTHVRIPDKSSVAGPNPTTGDVLIIFEANPESFSLEISSLGGGIIHRKDYHDFAGRTLTISELRNRSQGIYFIRIIRKSGTDVHRIIKIRD